MPEKQTEQIKNVMGKIDNEIPHDQLFYEQQITAEWKRFQKEIPELYEILRKTQADIKKLRETLHTEEDLQKFLGIQLQSPSETYLEIRKIQPYLQDLTQYIKELEQYQKTLENLIYQRDDLN